MAQTGYTPILIYSSTTASQAPSASNLTNSTLGSELAINITDGKLYYKDNANSVQVIGWKTVPTTAGGTGLTSYTAGDLLYYATGTTLSKLAIGASGRWLGSSGTAPQWNAPAALTKTDDTNVTLTLGGSASTALLNAASLTLGWTGTLATTRGGTGLSSFTANGVVYASSASALATGSALTYDGTTFNSPKSVATSTSAGAVVDVFTVINASSSANTESGIFFSPTTAAGNIRGARISAINDGNNVIGLKFYTGAGATITSKLEIDGATTGDVTLKTGNLIQGTAAKGINFTANTAAAGMTSQLLNWYEQGTWTPAAAAQVGTITSYTSSGTYTRVGRQVTLMGTITITNVGTGTGGLKITGLPFTYANQIVLSGREVAIIGKGLTGTGFGTGLIVIYADGTSPLATNAQYDFCITYFV